MTWEETIRFWGYDNLKRWTWVTLSQIAIPESSKRYLNEVGLPCKEDWTVRFNGETDDLPQVTVNSPFRVIGFDDVVPICLDENQNGSVVTVDADAHGAVRLINTCVEYFGEFLVVYKEYRIAARAMSEEEILSILPNFAGRMRRIDPKALCEPNNYWRLILEQMNDGLL